MNLRALNLQFIYGLCAVAGFIATMYFNILFIIEHQGFSAYQYIAENYVNYASSSIMNDIWVILVTFIIWSYKEARRLSMSNWWMYVLASCGIALAFSFPLFLYMRERQMKKHGISC